MGQEAVKKITSDIASLKHLKKEAQEVKSVVEVLLQRGNIIELLAKEDVKQHFKAQTESLLYLSQLSDECLFEMYEPAILNDNSAPFANFS